MHTNSSIQMKSGDMFSTPRSVNIRETPVPVLAGVPRGNVIVSRSQFPSSESLSVIVPGHNDPTTSYDAQGESSFGTFSSSPTAVTQLSVNVPSVSKPDYNLVDPMTERSQQQECNNRDNPSSKKADKNDCKTDFICSFCKQGFRHKSYYEYHLRTHTGERPFQCNNCPSSFLQRSKLNRHLSSCHNIKNSIYEDDNGEPDASKGNTCPECGKWFARSCGLKAHLLTHDGAKPFSCTKCNKKFSGLTALKNHEKSHEGSKNILCDICGKAFLLKKYLDLHLKTTHRKQERKHRCTRCRKEFHSVKDLARHQLIHSNDRSFTCNLCQAAFKRKDNLHRHLKLTHLLTPQQISKDHSNNPTTDAMVPCVPPPPPCVPPPPPPPLNQVSVIKSTHEVMMSISRGQI